MLASSAFRARRAGRRNEFDERQPKSNQSTILIEGGDDFDEEGGEEFDEENEPNFNRVEGAPAPVGQAGQAAGAGRPGRQTTIAAAPQTPSRWTGGGRGYAALRPGFERHESSSATERPGGTSGLLLCLEISVRARPKGYLAQLRKL